MSPFHLVWGGPMCGSRLFLTVALVPVSSNQIVPMMSFYLVWGGPMRGSRLFLAVALVPILKPSRPNDVLLLCRGALMRMCIASNENATRSI
eukprot:12416364-Karenia_brevis.AAC.1